MNKSKKVYVNIGKKSIKGITLISLVITIVIMLILAVVSVNLILGDNGLFKKTNDSAKKYSEAAVKEELQTASSSIYLNDNNEDLSNEDIANSMQEELSGLEWEDIDTLTGLYKGYRFIIDDNKSISIIGKADEEISEEVVPTVDSNNYNIADSGSLTANLSWNYNYYREQVKNITIKIDPNASFPSTALSGKKWDISNINTTTQGSVLVYFENSGDSSIPYNMFIVGKEKIALPENSSCYFYNYTHVESITGLSNFDCSKVKDMSNFFYFFGFYGLTTLDLTGFNTKNVTNMSSMFYNCGYTNMTAFNIGDKFYTNNVTNMDFMLYGLGHEQMKSLDLKNKFNTSNVTTMIHMFGECGYGSLETINLGPNFNTSKVTNMDFMFVFLGYNHLKELNLGDKFNTSNVINMQYMFNVCGSQKDNNMTLLNLGTAFTIPSGCNTDSMFTSTGTTNTIVKCSESLIPTITPLFSPERTIQKI